MRTTLTFAAPLAGAFLLMTPALTPFSPIQPAPAQAQGAPFGGSGGAKAGPPAATQPGGGAFSGRGSGGGAIGGRSGGGEARRAPSSGTLTPKADRGPRSGGVFGGGNARVPRAERPRIDRREGPSPRAAQPRRGAWQGRPADIRRRGVRHAWGPGVIFYFFDGHYYGDCAWLYRRAVATGSSYWWRRYRLCRDYSW